MTTATSKSKTVTMSQPTKREQCSLDEFAHRTKSKNPAPRIIVGEDNTMHFDHEDDLTAMRLIMNATGTCDYDFMIQFLGQVGNAASKGRKLDESAINFMLSVVQGLRPQDEMEAMLGAHMAAVHMAIMTFVRRLAHVDNIAQQDSAERALNKLMRTYTKQLEALKRYRTGGQQKMIVEHVTVNDGGQAVVGNVNTSQSGRGNTKKMQSTS